MTQLERLLGQVRTLGSGLYQVNPDGDKRARKLADLPCVYCAKPVRFARLRVQGGRAWPSIPKPGFAHLGCARMFDALVDAVFAAPSVATPWATKPEDYRERAEAIAAKCAACGHEHDGGCSVAGCICEKFHEQIGLNEADEIDLESLEAAGEVYDRLAAGTHYSDQNPHEF